MVEDERKFLFYLRKKKQKQQYDDTILGFQQWYKSRIKKQTIHFEMLAMTTKDKRVYNYV